MYPEKGPDLEVRHSGIMAGRLVREEGHIRPIASFLRMNRPHNYFIQVLTYILDYHGAFEKEKGCG
jgi:hypothetical protein